MISVSLPAEPAATDGTPDGEHEPADQDVAERPPGHRWMPPRGGVFRPPLRHPGHPRVAPAARQRSPGALAGLTDTGVLRSSAVRMIRVCSCVWAAGYPSPGEARSGRPM